MGNIIKCSYEPLGQAYNECRVLDRYIPKGERPMNQERKGFIKGIISGILITAVIVFIYTGVNITLIPARIEGFKKQEWYSFMQKANELVAILDTNYYEEVDKEKMFDGMYYGLVASIGDPYTTYMDTERFQSFISDTEGSYAGIGVYVSMDPEDGLLTIMQVFPGSPAEDVELQPGDKIVGVNGEDVMGLDDSEIIKKIKGPENTTVNLTIVRQSEGKSFDKELERRKIEVPTVEHEMLDGGIGYIKVLGFDAVTDQQFLDALIDLEKQGLKGLVVDLRNNGGGILDVALNITDLFVPEGIITYTIDGQGDKEVHSTRDDVYFNKPLTVLVNGNSASASEIFTGAIKDYEVGTVIGTTTFGKGLVQKPYVLNDGSAVKVTISRYYTPDGHYINKTGIEPDMEVELPENYRFKAKIPEEFDTQLNAAKDVLEEQIQQ